MTIQDPQFWWRSINNEPSDRLERPRFLVEIWNPDAQAKEQEVLTWFKELIPGRGFKKRSPKDSIIYRYRELPRTLKYFTEEEVWLSGAKWYEWPKYYPGNLKRQLLLWDGSAGIDAGYLDVEANELRIRSTGNELPGFKEPKYWSEIVPWDDSTPNR